MNPTQEFYSKLKQGGRGINLSAQNVAFIKQLQTLEPEFKPKSLRDVFTFLQNAYEQKNSAQQNQTQNTTAEPAQELTAEQLAELKTADVSNRLKITELETGITAARGALLEAQNVITKQRDRITELGNTLVNAEAKGALEPVEGYAQLKTAIEKALPVLYEIPNVELIPITDAEMLELLVDFARTDPTNVRAGADDNFPFKAGCDKIISRYRNQTQPGNEQP